MKRSFDLAHKSEKGRAMPFEGAAKALLAAD
jgi:hypothetical protein